MAQRDYYEILGVSRTASEDEIKRAYRRLAKEHHPDRNKGDKKSEERFKEVQHAYDVLSEPAKRAHYDRFGHAAEGAGFGGGSGGGSGKTWNWSSGEGIPFDLGDLGDLLNFGGMRGQGGESPSVEELFGRQRGRRGRGRGGRATSVGGDIEHTVRLSFEQAVRGTSLDLELAGAAGSRERLSVRIPAGVRDGQRIRVRGKGQPGRSPGDLYVVCSVEAHPYFSRLDDDLYLNVPITVSEALLGAKIDIPTLEGLRTVSVPPGTSSGTKLRLAGHGVMSAKDGKKGDLYVVIKIVPPRKPTARQQELARELGNSESESPREGLWSE